MPSDEHIDRVLDGFASEQDLAELAIWLEEPENMARYAQRAEIHANLRRSLVRKAIQSDAEALCDLDAVAKPPRAHQGKSHVLHRVLVPIALAVAASLLGLVVVKRELLDSWSNGPNTKIATIVGNVDALLLKDQKTWEAEIVSTGDFQLSQGLLNLEFANGVMLFLEAPASFNAISENLFVLHSGRLSAHVPASGIGFTVQTPQAEVVDFGTEFSIDAEDSSSEVHVFDGRVRVQSGSGSAKTLESVDVVASQAVRISNKDRKPVDIKIAKDRFIRDFDEPRRKYARSIKRLAPVAYYRMPIRDRGLVSDPPQYSGVVLTGDGVRPPHARGVFTGGSLRVNADSIGRGGRVDQPPAWSKRSFSIAAFVYLEARKEGVIASNVNVDEGCFEIYLNSKRQVCCRVKDEDAGWISNESESAIAIKEWTQVAVTVDDTAFQLYMNGEKVASVPSVGVSSADAQAWWLGTDATGTRQWNGRIDELAVFEYALGEAEIASLYQDAVLEIEQIQ